MLPIPDWYSSAVECFTHSILLETSLPDEHNCFSYLFLNPVEILQADELDELSAVFRALDLLRGSNLYAAGYLSYECAAWLLNKRSLFRKERTGVPLAWFGVYRRPYIFDHRTGAQLQGTGAPPQLPVLALDRNLFDVSNLKIEMGNSDYLKRVKKIRKYIARGDCYQVNLATRAGFNVQGSPAALYRQLLLHQHAPYCAFLHLNYRYILSLSPELFFRLSNGNVTVRPMKGTARRGVTIEEDALIRDWLREDEKNRSENIMIVDLLRSDLGRISEIGSVKVTELFGIEPYETLYQMTSTITARLRSGLGWRGVFEALFPSGSVTGAPKLRTMEIVRELEPSPRGVYTGTIGFIDPGGNAVFNVPIRTIELNDGHGSIGVGSGITYDSVPEEEYEECLLKLRFLTGREKISH